MCHRTREILLFQHAFSRLVLPTSVATCLVLPLLSYSLQNKRACWKTKAFPPLNRIICRGTDRRSVGQREEWNWSWGVSHKLCWQPHLPLPKQRQQPPFPAARKTCQILNHNNTQFPLKTPKCMSLLSPTWVPKYNSKNLKEAKTHFSICIALGSCEIHRCLIKSQLASRELLLPRAPQSQAHSVT